MHCIMKFSAWTLLAVISFGQGVLAIHVKGNQEKMLEHQPSMTSSNVAADSTANSKVAVMLTNDARANQTALRPKGGRRVSTPQRTQAARRVITQRVQVPPGRCSRSMRCPGSFLWDNAMDFVDVPPSACCAPRSWNGVRPEACLTWFNSLKMAERQTQCPQGPWFNARSIKGNDRYTCCKGVQKPGGKTKKRLFKRRKNKGQPDVTCAKFKCPDYYTLRRDAAGIRGHTKTACCQQVATTCYWYGAANFGRFEEATMDPGLTSGTYSIAKFEQMSDKTAKSRKKAKSGKKMKTLLELQGLFCNPSDPVNCRSSGMNVPSNRGLVLTGSYLKGLKFHIAPMDFGPRGKPGHVRYGRKMNDLQKIPHETLLKGAVVEVDKNSYVELKQIGNHLQIRCPGLVQLSINRFKEGYLGGFLAYRIADRISDTSICGADTSRVGFHASRLRVSEKDDAFAKLGLDRYPFMKQMERLVRKLGKMDKVMEFVKERQDPSDRSVCPAEVQEIAHKTCVDLVKEMEAELGGAVNLEIIPANWQQACVREFCSVFNSGLDEQDAESFVNNSAVSITVANRRKIESQPIEFMAEEETSAGGAGAGSLLASRPCSSGLAAVPHTDAERGTYQRFLPRAVCQQRRNLLLQGQIALKNIQNHQEGCSSGMQLARPRNPTEWAAVFQRVLDFGSASNNVRYWLGISWNGIRWTYRGDTGSPFLTGFTNNWVAGLTSLPSSNSGGDMLCALCTGRTNSTCRAVACGGAGDTTTKSGVCESAVLLSQG